jgi:hypothetical protein
MGTTKYIRRIISGGQTGVDFGALKAAKKSGLKTGGTAPKGFKTEDGPSPKLGSIYGLKEHASEKWSPRTKQNVQDSDLTIIIDPDQKGGPGTKLTGKLAEELRKHRLLVYSPTHKMQEYHIAGTIKYIYGIVKAPLVINVAGPRESSIPGIKMVTYLLFKKTFNLLKKWEEEQE